MRIGIDVDNTVVDVSPSWLLFLKMWFRLVKEIPEDNINYNLASYFEPTQQPSGMSLQGLEWWNFKNIYDHALPLAHAKEVIDSLSKDNEIIFISKVTGEHYASKKSFLSRNFNKFSFVATDRKDLIDVDIFIDDRNDFLNMSNARIKFKIKTPYTQDVELTCDVIEVDNFLEIAEHLKKLEIL